ncbi:MAG TPA: magnesium transporter CorA family protein [Gemmatimonadaceae bacterium]|nr:magnesium transporter CorA family protein [Gemmatimonadaceae bacterium]
MTDTPAAPRIVFFEPNSKDARRDLTLDEVNRIIAERRGHLWVDVDLSVPAQADFLAKIQNLHPLAIEDATARNSRPKLEEYPEFLFMIVVGVRFHEGTPDPYDLETYDLSFFLGANWAVTVHDGPSQPVDDVASRVEKKPELLERGSDRLVHAIMDASVDAYFPLLDKLDEFVDNLEQRVIVDFDRSALKEIFAVKRLVLALRRHVAPEREVFSILTNRPSALLSPESQTYFRDVYDHVLRINDSLDSYRDLLSSVLDSYLTQVSNRLGTITKGLSVIATMSIPFVVISGMWGMNVEYIPLQHHAHAFWWMFAIQFGLGLLLLLILRFWKLL